MMDLDRASLEVLLSRLEGRLGEVDASEDKLFDWSYPPWSAVGALVLAAPLLIAALRVLLDPPDPVCPKCGAETQVAHWDHQPVPRSAFRVATICPSCRESSWLYDALRSANLAALSRALGEGSREGGSA